MMVSGFETMLATPRGSTVSVTHRRGHEGQVCQALRVRRAKLTLN